MRKLILHCATDGAGLKSPTTFVSIHSDGSTVDHLADRHNRADCSLCRALGYGGVDVHTERRAQRRDADPLPPEISLSRKQR